MNNIFNTNYDNDNDKAYTNDIEMVMDFMKLSILFDKSENTQEKNIHEKLKTILEMQKSILELLPVAQSNRMASVYELMVSIYRKNKQSVNEQSKSEQTKSETLLMSKPSFANNSSANKNNKKNDHYMILFYDLSRPESEQIIKHWNEFKRNNSSENFSMIEYDINDSSLQDSIRSDNSELFSLFKIKNIPSVIKVKLDEPFNSNLISTTSTSTLMDDSSANDSSNICKYGYLKKLSNPITLENLTKFKSFQN
jgi:hypothetical protein